MRPLVVQLTTDDQEKTAAALTVAMTAAASGAHVELWLSGPATMFAVAGEQPPYDLEYAPDLDPALSSVAQVHVCSQCAARRGLSAGRLRPGAKISGAASLVEALLSRDAQGLVY